MRLYLADSSIWIAVIRRRAPYLTESLRLRIARDEVATCAPVALEVLGGSPGGAEYDRDWVEAWQPLAWLPLSDRAGRRAVEVQRELAHTPDGVRGRSAMDYLIAACAEEAGEDVVLWHWDADLTAICEQTGQPHEPEHERAREHGLD